MNFSPINQEVKKVHSSKLPYLLGSFVLILFVAQVLVSNRLAASGLKLTKIETEIQTLTENSTDMRQKIASFSSLKTIEDKAKGMGFVITTKPVYLAQEPPVAFESSIQ